MKLDIKVPVFGYVTTTRDAYKIAIGTEAVEVELPEYSSDEISKAISFKVKPNKDADAEEHVYYSIEGKLIKKSGVSLGLSYLQKPVCFSKRRMDDHHPLFSDIFTSFYKTLSQHGGGLSRWEAKNVIPVKLGDFLSKSANSFDSLGESGMVLGEMKELPIKDYDSAVFKEQIDGFKERIKNFILVDGEICEICPEPIAEVSSVSWGHGVFDVKLSESALDYNNISGLIDCDDDFYREKKIYIPLNDLDRDSDILSTLGFDIVNIERLISDVEIYDQSMFNATYSALTALNYSVDLARKFASNTAVVHKRGVMNTTSLAGDKLRNLSVDELKLYQDLMNAIDNASPFGVTSELDDCIAGIKNLYAPGVEKTSFGNRNLVDRISEIIEDSVIDPVEEYSNPAVPFK